MRWMRRPAEPGGSVRKARDFLRSVVNGVDGGDNLQHNAGVSLAVLYRFIRAFRVADAVFPPAIRASTAPSSEAAAADKNCARACTSNYKIGIGSRVGESNSLLASNVSSVALVLCGRVCVG